MIDTLAAVTHAALFGAPRRAPGTSRSTARSADGSSHSERSPSSSVGPRNATVPLVNTATSSAICECVADVLLDDQQGRPGVAHRREVLVHLVDDDRREPERELVRDEQARRVHEHPRQRQHALLATRERPGDLLAPLPQPREQLVRAVERVRRPRGDRTRGRNESPRFSSTLNDANTDRPSGAWTIPSRAMRYVRSLLMLDALEEHVAARRSDEPRRDPRDRRLARAVRAEQREHLALRDLERHTEERAERAVARARRRGAPAAAPRRRLAGSHELSEVRAPHRVVGEDRRRSGRLAIRWPKSSTDSRVEKLRTNSTSCSTSSTAVPRSACTARSVSASASVSRPSSPDDGSSSRSSLGSVISARPTSTSRARPRLSASTARSAIVLEPQQRQRPVRAGVLVRGRLGEVEHVLPEPPGPEPGPLGDEQVVAHRHSGEQLDALERASEAEPGPAVHRASG